MERNLLFTELARAVKYKIPVEGELFLRQCASGRNLFHLPASYRYPTGNIPGYFISLNWNEDFIVLEKERKENNEYFIINRNREVVNGPFSVEEYKEKCKEFHLTLPLIPMAELDWVINI
ncbi:hypothetical protein [Jeotgalibaca ciconiae]|uniref:Uncharacterized protein n=1 Tax=Jeotgalibaca ciconiae TaxID=2496265 RepID=A0A3S9HA56_9LACT|nr:hypothetical protein [Jeotgalibaca ciconiae]AZP04211.1 hypothetical protein EJN90_05755 [Jeotgalibaca ciconiae]HJB24849.1 DUF3997 domain-containing protein [Candidatus Jeotgalibaca pullicola]